MIFFINHASQNVIIKNKIRPLSWDQSFFGQLHPGDKEKEVANGIKAFRKNKNGPILPYFRQNVLACWQHVFGFLYCSTFLSNL
jgi:hypothetical protein